ncbi:hypothetical protein [Dehalobacter sp. DCM]
MADYFARNLKTDYQKTTLWEAIKQSSLIKPSETELLKPLTIIV